ncbi:hypothetical protein, no similarity [Maudiozyma barnettii]|uniref:Uncharacterized protein n=1 Tax=Maudiozyma barnettii TaxID=61262 RepID=A0A8H2ZKR7_9SACH|nr:hypothetical protein, no similarity [Kazachstania barnettii]CAB4257238.1 hypothetical protein, no similarity [Kazachstania barnettii]CAD1779608.1 hypothetical protein, no similarity [Kazachstania barnettii]
MNDHYSQFIQDSFHEHTSKNVDDLVHFTFFKDGNLLQTQTDCKKLAQSKILEDILDSTDGTVCVILPGWDMDDYQDIIGSYLLWYGQSHKLKSSSHVNITSSIFPDQINDIMNAVYGTQVFTYYQHENFCVLHNVPEKLIPNANVYIDSTANMCNQGLIRFIQLQFWYEYLKVSASELNGPMAFMQKDRCFLTGRFEGDEENEERKNLFECYDWTFYHLLAFLSRTTMLYSLLQPNAKNSRESQMMVDLYQKTLHALEDKEYSALKYIKEYKDMRREIDDKKQFNF